MKGLWEIVRGLDSMTLKGWLKIFVVKQVHNYEYVASRILILHASSNNSIGRKSNVNHFHIRLRQRLLA